MRIPLTQPDETWCGCRGTIGPVFEQCEWHCRCSEKKPDLWLFKWAAPSGSYICKGIPAMEGYRSGAIWEFLSKCRARDFGARLGAALQAGTAVSAKKTAGPAFPHPGEPCQSAIGPMEVSPKEKAC